jgi:hypothetical protein
MLARFAAVIDCCKKWGKCIGGIRERSGTSAVEFKKSPVPFLPGRRVPTLQPLTKMLTNQRMRVDRVGLMAVFLGNQPFGAQLSEQPVPLGF